MLSSKISCVDDEIARDEYVILPPTDMAKRETIGKRLKRARLGLGLSVPQLRDKIKEELRAELGETTIHDAEKDKTSNPGLKTLELISLGVGLDPLSVIALGLDDPPELDPGYTESQFARLSRVYKQVSKAKRPIADELVQMVIEKLESWR